MTDNPTSQNQNGPDQPRYGQGQQPDWTQQEQQPGAGQGQQPRYGQGQQPDWTQQGQQPRYGQGRQPDHSQPPAQSYADMTGRPGHMPAGRRPGTILAAAVMTFIGSTFGIIGGLTAALTSDSPENRAAFRKALEAQGQTATDQLMSTVSTAIMVFGALLALWCLAAIVLAVFAQRGSHPAAVTLLVMGIIWCVFSLISLIGDPVSGLISLAWTGTATALWYLVPASRAWFTGRGRASR